MDHTHTHTPFCPASVKWRTSVLSTDSFGKGLIFLKDARQQVRTLETHYKNNKIKILVNDLR